jgi:hypothetical protein
MAAHRFCDGMSRRDALKAGVISGLGFGLADYFRCISQAEVRPGAAEAAIFVFLAGGPSHIDTFDPKPEAPEEYRGEFKAIPTAVAGVYISEHLPKLAQLADKFALIRSVSHTLAAHEQGTRYLTTGNRPIPSLAYPGYGSVVAREKGERFQVPAYVAIPSTPETPGYLGLAYGALQTNSMPAFGRPFSVRGISLRDGLAVVDLERRHRLLEELDTAFRQFEDHVDLLTGLDEFSNRALRILLSSRTREAFDISREPLAVAERFGKHGFGQSCLLAVRLVEAGVRFVTINYGGWDTHADNFRRLRDRNLPELDQGLSALLEALHQRGLLEKTVVFVTGEFGRTPKVNPRAGRDHWPRAMSVLMAGGGVQGGGCIGATDPKGMAPTEDPLKPDDLAASFYYCLGIDPSKEYDTPTGRPVMLVRDGKPVRDLFA